MTPTRGVRRLAAIVAAIAPARWRDALEGDFLDDRRGRARAVGALAASALRLRLEHSRHEGILSMRFMPSADTLNFSLKQAWRSLRARPAFAAITVLTLTLGIGANTAVFSLANWLIFRPVPGVARPEELSTVRLAFPTGGYFSMSVPEMNAIAGATGLAATGAAAETPFHVSTTPAGVGGNAAVRVDGAAVTTNYFDVLGQHALIGRVFAASEDDPGNANVAIVSDRFWRASLGGGRAAIGTSIFLSGHAFTVIGVAAEGFRGPDRSGHTDIWVPLASYRTSMPTMPADLLVSTSGILNAAIGRRAAGATNDQLNAQLAVISQQLQHDHPKSTKYSNASLTAMPGLDVPVWQRVGLRQMFALLSTVAGLLLLLACANVANMIFTRTHERRAEFATRQALGAGRGTIVRQILIEALLLSSAGTALSLAAAQMVNRATDGLVVTRTVPALSGVSLDWRVFAFAVGVSTITCLAAALLPAIFGSRTSLSAGRQGSRGFTAASRRTRRALTFVQVTVAVTLLASGLLLVRSMLARYRIPLGYDTAHVLTFAADPGVQGYAKPQQRQFFLDTIDALERQPGITRASVAMISPFQLIGAGGFVRPADTPSQPFMECDSNNVSNGFFPALGARLISGRDFTAAEGIPPPDPSNKVVILNASMATALFGRTDVAGRQLESQYPAGQQLTIVGVVADMHTKDVGDKAVAPTMYVPFGQSFAPQRGTFHVRFTGSSAAAEARVRAAVHALDPSMPIYDVSLLSASVDRYLVEQRLLSLSIGVFALLAAVVAALGIYGVLSRSVAERRREFGIRAALGAGPGVMASLVAREALVVTSIGAAAGVGGALWLSRYLQSRLFGVSAHDPLSLVSAAAIALAIGSIAAVAPARRAARVDVVGELR